MRFLWDELRLAMSLIFHGNPTLLSVIAFTLEVALLATAAALIGIPAGLALELGRFRGRRTLQLLANAGLALPPVLVGLFLFLLFAAQGPLGGLHRLRIDGGVRFAREEAGHAGGVGGARAPAADDARAL